MSLIQSCVNIPLEGTSDILLQVFALELEVLKSIEKIVKIKYNFLIPIILINIKQKLKVFLNVFKKKIVDD